MEIVRTTKHSYLKDEEDAMRAFYGGKICVITLSDVAVWAHMLNATSEPCNPQLQWMLQRQLHQNRYPAHGAEIRENLIPLDPAEHRFIDLCPPRATLFLHEDIVAKTLQFERELKEWRTAEVQAGRGDPGRPGYSYVFLTAEGTLPPTPHRWHAGIHYRGTLRSTPDDTDSTMFRKEQCPGIDPTHAHPFPIINTLLSIPFSLLYNLPRLAGLVTSSPFRRELGLMATEIVSLWAWDPEPLNIPIIATNPQRTAMPQPIYDASRNATFATMRPLPLSTALSTIGLGAPSDALTAVPPEHDMNMEKEPIGPTVAAPSLNRSASLSGSMESTPESECGGSNDELGPKLHGRHDCK